MADIMFNRAETIMTTVMKKRSVKALNESYADWENEIEMPMATRKACYVNVSGIMMPVGI
jgi:hypothetical protein